MKEEEIEAQWTLSKQENQAKSKPCLLAYFTILYANELDCNDLWLFCFLIMATRQTPNLNDLSFNKVYKKTVIYDLCIANNLNFLSIGTCPHPVL